MLGDTFVRSRYASMFIRTFLARRLYFRTFRNPVSDCNRASGACTSSAARKVQAAQIGEASDFGTQQNMVCNALIASARYKQHTLGKPQNTVCNALNRLRTLRLQPSVWRSQKQRSTQSTRSTNWGSHRFCVRGLLDCSTPRYFNRS